MARDFASLVPDPLCLWFHLLQLNLGRLTQCGARAPPCGCERLAIVAEQDLGQIEQDVFDKVVFTCGTRAASDGFAKRHPAFHMERRGRSVVLRPLP